MSWRSGLSEDEYFDALDDARRDEYDDKIDRVCNECGNEWWSHPVRATRTDPAYCMVECCPTCGSDDSRER